MGLNNKDVLYVHFYMAPDLAASTRRLLNRGWKVKGVVLELEDPRSEMTLENAFPGNTCEVFMPGALELDS